MSVLVTLPSWALTSLPAARQYVRAELADDDATLTMLVRAASARIERHTQRKLKSRSYAAAAAGPPVVVESRLMVSGHGENCVTLPEWPVTSFAGAWYAEAQNDTSLVLTRLNDAVYQLEPGGIVRLLRDVFPHGTNNIRVAATCGYLAGTHDAELYELEHACLRVVQVLWQDYRNQVGRAESVSGGGQSLSFASGDIPPDVKMMLEPYMRP
jgi:hypothetical protein